MLTLLGWPLGDFLVASRSQVITLLEAWGDFELGQGKSVVRGGSPGAPPPTFPRKGDSLLWGFQHGGHEWESGLPEKEACPPVTRVSLGETWEKHSGVTGCCPFLGTPPDGQRDGREADLHSPGWWGMASAGHSALPQEPLLEVEPRRPGGER